MELALWGIDCQILPDAPQETEDGTIADPESAAEWFSVLEILTRNDSCTVICGSEAFATKAPAPAALHDSSFLLKPGLNLDPADLAATLDEARFWTGVRTNGVMDRNLVASSIVNSAERRMLVIQEYYQTLLGRAADPGGLQFWLNLTQSGAPLEQVLAGIAASEEYFQRQGGTSDGFVRGLYRDVLGRIAPPSQPELDFWIARLGIAPRGPQAARADVALGFALSDEYRGGLIDAWFLQFLGRSPSTQERNNLLDMFHRGASQVRVIVEILLRR